MTDARRRAEAWLAENDGAAWCADVVPILRSLLADEDERGLHNPWRSRALDAEMALRVLLDQKRSGREPDVERFVDLAMRHASPLRRPAPPAADEVREAAFAKFGRALLPKWWDDGNPGDIDGGDAQEAAEACGLWHPVERHPDGVECDWCGNEEPCGELTEAGLSALAARGGAG